MSDSSNKLIFASDEIEMKAKFKTSRDLTYEVGLTNIQQTLLLRGFDYTHANKCEQLFVERGKLGYTRSAKHAVVA
jgi:hypothetical protein